MPIMKKLHIQKLFYLSFMCISIVLFFGCFATTNYYTGRTLPKKKASGSFGFDGIIVQSTEDGEVEKTELPLSPSIGYSYGLPYRFEIGIRTYMFMIWEAMLRHEITPHRFKHFDASVNLHLGLMPEFTYVKYGLTLSKDVGKIEPFLSYFQYGSSDNPIQGNRVWGGGLAIDIPHAQLIFEVIYPDYPDDDNRYIIYNVGIRTQ